MSDGRKKNIPEWVLSKIRVSFPASPFNFNTQDQACLYVPVLHAWESHLDGSLENVLPKSCIYGLILAYKFREIYFEVVSFSCEIRADT